MNDQIVSDYYFIPFPYLSQSACDKYDQCPYKFKRIYLDGLSEGKNTAMQIGTSLHYLYFKFFDYIDINYLLKLDWQKDYGTAFNEVYMYFYSVMCAQLPDDTNNDYVIYNCKAFSRFETEHWYDVRSQYTDRGNIIKYFMVNLSNRELKMKDDFFQIYGTTDRISYEGDKTIIIDYKTGKTPSAVVHAKISNNAYSSANLGHYTFQGNLYVLLYLLNKGYNLDYNGDEVLHFMKDGVRCDEIIKEYDYMFVFTGPKEGTNWKSVWPEYSMSRKKTSMVSIRSIIRKLATIRNVTTFARVNVNKARYVCPNCSFYINDCEKVYDNVLGNLCGSESSPPEDIPDT